MNRPELFGTFDPRRYGSATAAKPAPVLKDFQVTRAEAKRMFGVGSNLLTAPIPYVIAANGERYYWASDVCRHFRISPQSAKRAEREAEIERLAGALPSGLK